MSWISNHRLAALSYVGIVTCALFAAGAGRLLGDELTFWRAAQGSHFAPVSDSRFYRILGSPVLYFAFDLSGGYSGVLTLLAGVAIAATVWWIVSVFVRGLEGSSSGSAPLLAGLFVLALPFSLYGVLIRVTFSQLFAIALMGAACAAVFAYMKAPVDDGRNRRRRLIFGSAAYGLSLFTYEVALLSPIVIAAIIAGSQSSWEARRSALKEWGFALAIPLTIYLWSQVSFISANSKLANAMQIVPAARAEAALPAQAVGKVTKLVEYVTWAWRVTAESMGRGDWHGLMVVPAMVFAGIGARAAAREGLPSVDNSVANAFCLTGMAVFASTMSL